MNWAIIVHKKKNDFYSYRVVLAMENNKIKLFISELIGAQNRICFIPNALK